MSEFFSLLMNRIINDIILYMSIAQSLIFTSCFIILVMTLAWIICIKIKNFGFVDFVWSASFGLLAFCYFAISDGWHNRKKLITMMIVIWSWRLASHLYTRLMSHHPREDVRYAQLRIDWAKNLNFKFFIFFQFQALIVIALTVPFFMIMQNKTENFSLWEILSVLLWIIAVFGETLSDKQLKDFKLNPENKGKTCQIGLWKYSRHPNYFFEWLIWVSYFLFALGTENGIFTFYTPALMLFFLTKMTGIPITEQLSIKSRGDEYRDYQRRTSMFIPWFPK